jgi:hypothetical protein
MTDIIIAGGSVFQTGIRTALISTGLRGPQGRPGDTGPDGNTGAGINILGEWNSGMVYGPNDAVTDQSSTLEGVVNLYIQRSNAPSSVSLTPPGQDPARWIETGVLGFSGTTGNIWSVLQFTHGFTAVGTPVFWNASLNIYQQASSAVAGQLPVGVIREIPDADTIILQSSGLVPVVAPALVEGGGGWVDGTVYYIRPSGLLSAAPPPSGFVVPVFKAIDAGGIVFPYQNASLVPTPVPAPVPATSYVKVDDISSGFNGIAVNFPVFVAATPVSLAPAESFSVFIDGHRQQPLFDYFITNGGSGNSVLTFASPPQSFQEFWCIYAAI